MHASECRGNLRSAGILVGVDWTPLFIVALIALGILRLARARYPAARRSRIVGVATGVLSLGLLVVVLIPAGILIFVLGNRGP
jgi:hypothetical protein